MAKKKPETLGEAVRDIFGTEHVKFFHFSDSLSMIEGDTFLKCHQKSHNEAEIIFGGDNGEVTIKVCRSAEQLRNLIRALLM